MKRTLRSYTLLFCGLIAAYLLFALTANLLPNKPILHHAAKTVDRGDLAADFGYMMICRPAYYMDNFTDALIINQACNGGSNHLLTSMLLNPRVDGGGEQCESLRRLTQGDTSLYTLHYGRYWHGSTFAMRFLLLFGDYTSLRILFYLLSTVIMAWVAAVIYRRIGLATTALYMLAMAMVNVFMMQLSIQFLPVLLIALAASLWVLYRVQRPGQLCLLLFAVGSLTAYFDLLTCPMMTWGIPMCVYLLKEHKDPMCPQPLLRIRNWTVASFLWVVGYGLTWVSKWLIATLLTGENVIRDGARQFAIRAGGQIDYSRWDALANNLNLLPWPYVALTLCLLAALAIWRFNRKGLPTALLCLLTALPPLAWYLVTADHSYLHYWFTYRSLSVPLMALFFAAVALTDWPRLKAALPSILFKPKSH